jgi:O-antigen biosynthesis protein
LAGWWQKLTGRGATPMRREGDAARDARRWDEAAERYRAYLDARPDDFAIWVQLGHALKEAGDLPGAGEAYGAAFRLRPRDADLLLNMGHLAKRRGDWAEAAYRYRASYRVDANNHARTELMSPDVEPHLDAAEARLAREERAAETKRSAAGS